MKLYLILLSIFSVLTLHQSDWIKFENQDSGFSILVPTTMLHTYKEIPTEIGEIIFNTFQCKPAEEDRNALYIVHHYEYPDSLLTTDTSGLALELLEATVEESMITLNGTLDYRRSLNYEGHTGILYRIKYNKGNAVVKSKAFIIGDDVYVLQVYATIDNSINNLMDYFLDSFQHLGNE